MNLQTLMLTKNPCYIKAEKITPCGVLWHSTGANNPNLKRYVGPDDGLLGKNLYGNHWNRAGATLCGHAMIGKLNDGTVATYHTLPFNVRCWLSGSPTSRDKVKKDPRGNANDMGYIQFEICEDNTKNKDYAMQVYREAVEFSAMVLKMYNLDPLGKNRHGLPVVLDHASGHQLGIASNHGDVLHWFGKWGITMDKIRQDIAAEMGQVVLPSPDPGTVPYTTRLEKGTPYYKEAKVGPVVGTILATGLYTIVQEQGAFGWLKSGAGWVQIKDEPAPPKPTPTPTPPKPDPVPKLVDTWARANTLKQGSKGKHVEVLQALLQTKGYDVQAIDGSFGAVTDKQVRAYQAAQKLTVDGIVGYETWPVILK